MHTWSALGTGLNGWVMAIAISGSTVYVGGLFTTAGGIAATSIAKWDTTTNTWSAVGVALYGLNGQVNALAVSGSDVYVGGKFTTAAGVAVNYITKWDAATATWSALGVGLDRGVYAIAISGSAVYVGGKFTTAGDVAANYIAKWDAATNTWSALGTGLDNVVRAIAISGSAVYVGGNFSTAGGVAANRIAKWDATTNTWSALGTGLLNNGVAAIAISGSTVYVVGEFITAGGVGANYIAKWDGAAWSPWARGRTRGPMPSASAAVTSTSGATSPPPAASRRPTSPGTSRRALQPVRQPGVRRALGRVGMFRMVSNRSSSTAGIPFG